MLMTNFMKGRKSVREFKNKKASIDILDHVAEYIETLEEEEGTGNIRFRVYENGERIFNSFKGLGGYSGVMIESPHYVGLELINNLEETMIFGAFYLERLITRLNYLELDSCWISLDKVDEETKKSVLGDSVGTINYLLAFGYGKQSNPFLNEPSSHRIGVEDLVFDRKLGSPIKMEELENRGLGDIFYYVRFAPSSLNKQPWRFILDGDKLFLLLKYEKDEKPSLVDAGIIMYYYVKLAETIGLHSRWILIPDKVEELGSENYKYVAEISL